MNRPFFEPATRRRIALLAASALVACASPEEKLERYTKSGYEFLEQGDAGRANVQFRNALKIDEDHVPAIEGLVDIAEDQKNFKAMFGLLQRIVRVDPDNVDARADLAKLQLLSGDEDAAIDTIDAALDVAPDAAALKAVKAAVLFRAGDRAGAVALAEEAFAADASLQEATTVLATAAIQDGEFDAAIARLDQSIAAGAGSPVLHLLKIQALKDQSRDVEGAYAELIAAYPRESAFRRLYAAHLLSAGDADGARRELLAAAETTPDKARGYIDVARLDREAKGPAAAEATFKEFIGARPDDADLKFAYASFLNSEGRSDDALGLYGALAEANDEATALRAQNAIARAAIAKGETGRAEALIEDILAADERNASALMKRAALKIADEEAESAINDLRIVLADAPDQTVAKMLTAAAFEKNGDIVSAENQFTQALDDSARKTDIAPAFARFLLRNDKAERAERVLTEAAAADPSHEPTLKMLAAVRLGRSDWRGAEAAAELLGDAEADEGLVSRIRGAAFAGLGDYRGAIDALTAANEKAPLSRSALSTLVRALVAEGQADVAEELLRDNIAADANAYDARVQLARLLQQTNRSADAAASLVEAIDVAPDRAVAYELLAIVYRSQSRAGDARAVVERGLANASRKDGLLVLKADGLLAAGDKSGALAIYEDVIERRPNDAVVANNFAALTNELRDDAASNARAADAVEPLKNARNASFLDTYGWAKVRAGDVDEGVAALRRAVEANPDLLEAQFHLGAALHAAGDAAAAAPHLQRAAAAGGDDAPAFAEKARALLGE